MANDFDFGFTAVDEVPSEAPAQPAAPSIDEDKIMDKLIELEAKIFGDLLRQYAYLRFQKLPDSYMLKKNKLQFYESAQT